MMTNQLITTVERIDAESQALVYSQQVAAGAKLAAEIMVKDDLADTVVGVALREGCLSRIENPSSGWVSVVIYKYPFVGMLVDEMHARPRVAGRPSMLAVWSEGKLFGYSDYEIAKYLEDHGYVDSALR